MPLIVKVPWMEKLAGTVISAPVELIDIYPTAAALTRSGPVANASALDGVDFSPVLLAAAAANTAGAVAVAAPRVQRTHTFSDFPRCGEELENPQASWPTSAFEKNYCKSDATSAIFAMGYSLRSENMRYTRWMRWNGTALAVHPDGWLDDDDATPSLLGEELYDHTGDDGTDFDKFPLGHSNLAAKPAMAAQLKTHRAILASFFRDGDESVAFASADSAGQICRAKADDTLALRGNQHAPTSNNISLPPIPDQVWFGVWASDVDSHDFSSVVWDSWNDTAIEMQGGPALRFLYQAGSFFCSANANSSAPHGVSWTFFPDYQRRWNRAVPMLRRLLQNKKILGVR